MKAADEKVSEPIKNIESAAVMTKPKRELPPLKKIRSLKKVELDENVEKENTSAKTLEQYLDRGFCLPSKPGKQDK